MWTASRRQSLGEEQGQGCRRPSLDAHRSQGCEVAAPDLPSTVTFPDPRNPSADKRVGVVGFYYPDSETECDKLCQASFLGNFWNVGKNGVRIKATAKGCRTATEMSFSNSEAAFQALKFWDRAEDFSGLSGEEAFQLKSSLTNKEDWTYGGCGSNWNAMFRVLDAKFHIGSPMATCLVSTGDAFLIEHNSDEGWDKVWSNNHVGDGMNWLGLQLMIIRDELTGKRAWTDFIFGKCRINPNSGKFEPGQRRWQDTVQNATEAILMALQDVGFQKEEGGVPGGGGGGPRPSRDRASSPGGRGGSCRSSGGRGRDASCPGDRNGRRTYQMSAPNVSSNARLRSSSHHRSVSPSKRSHNDCPNQMPTCFSPHASDFEEGEHERQHHQKASADRYGSGERNSSPHHSSALGHGERRSSYVDYPQGHRSYHNPPLNRASHDQCYARGACHAGNSQQRLSYQNSIQNRKISHADDFSSKSPSRRNDAVEGRHRSSSPYKSWIGDGGCHEKDQRDQVDSRDEFLKSGKERRASSQHRSHRDVSDHRKSYGARFSSERSLRAKRSNTRSSSEADSDKTEVWSETENCWCSLPGPRQISINAQDDAHLIRLGFDETGAYVKSIGHGFPGYHDLQQGDRLVSVSGRPIHGRHEADIMTIWQKAQREKDLMDLGVFRPQAAELFG